MIRLIVGNKGSGKTKRLISMVNEAVAAGKGDVVCIEKTTKLNNDLDRGARLIDIDGYDIEGYVALHGFLSGLYAANYDTTDIFVDQTLKIGGESLAEFAIMLSKIRPVSETEGFNLTFAVSCDVSLLPASLKEYVI